MELRGDKAAGALLFCLVGLFSCSFCGIEATTSRKTTRPLPSSSPSPAPPCNGTTETYVESVDNCCLLCPPGFGITLPCTRYNTSECAPCLPGSYSATADHVQECHKCTECSANEKQVRACNATHATKCECVQGYFYDFKLGSCMKCKSCPHGKGADRICTIHSDTVCIACPNGSYSNVYNSDGPCLPCQQCRPGHFASHCTNRTNAVCTRTTADTNIMDMPGDRANSQDSSVVKYVICGLGGVVIFVCLAYVFYKNCSSFPSKWSLRKGSPKGVKLPPGLHPAGGCTSGNSSANCNSHNCTSAAINNNIPFNNNKLSGYLGNCTGLERGDGGVGNYYSWNHPYNPGPVPKQTDHSALGCQSAVTLNQANSAASEPLLEPKQAFSVSKFKRYKDIPLAVQAKIEDALCVSGQWRDVASNLGYTDEKQAAIVAKRRKHRERYPRFPNSDPVHLILQDWSRSSQATLEVLMTSCEALQIANVTQLLTELINGQCCMTADNQNYATWLCKQPQITL